MQKTLIFIATHIINQAVINEYVKMTRGKDYDCILAIDNTNLNMEYENRIEEKEFFGVSVKCFFFDIQLNDEMNLPRYFYNKWTDKFSKIMWYNADYRFYYVKKYFPDYDYYWQFEYDVYCNGESYQTFFDKYSSQNEDCLILDYRQEDLNGSWYWSANMEWLYEDSDIYGSLFPISRMSSAAIDYCYERRLAHKALYDKVEDKTGSNWAFCELFSPTELKKGGFSIASLAEPYITWDKEYDLNDSRLFENPDNCLYHPVKGQFLQREQKLKQENNELKSKYRRLEEQNKNLTKQNEELKAIRVDLTKVSDKLNLKVKNLKQKNKELETLVKKYSEIKFNLFGIKISHKRKIAPANKNKSE